MTRKTMKVRRMVRAKLKDTEGREQNEENDGKWSKKTRDSAEGEVWRRRRLRGCADDECAVLINIGETLFL